MPDRPEDLHKGETRATWRPWRKHRPITLPEKQPPTKQSVFYTKKNDSPPVSGLPFCNANVSGSCRPAVRACSGRPAARRVCRLDRPDAVGRAGRAYSGRPVAGSVAGCSAVAADYAADSAVRSPLGHSPVVLGDHPAQHDNAQPSLRFLLRLPPLLVTVEISG